MHEDQDGFCQVKQRQLARSHTFDWFIRPLQFRIRTGGSKNIIEIEPAFDNEKLKHGSDNCQALSPNP